jgi:predicted HicB family RNase H-like nuclease
MKKKSSVITPPPQMEPEQGSDGSLALNEQEKKEALLKLIRKGAPSVPVPQEAISEENERVRFSIRIPRGLLERVTQAAESRDLKTPVNTWITEAILSQLKKEGC